MTRMRTALALAAFLVASPAMANTSEVMILNELACEVPPQTALTIHELITRGVIEASPFEVGDSISYFRPRKPMTLDGLPIAAVYGYEDSTAFRFKRSPGTSPGNTFGIITAAPRDVARKWQAAHGKNLSTDDTSSIKMTGTDIQCSGSLIP